MFLSKEGLAAIFYTDKNYEDNKQVLLLDSIALINYDVITSSFEVKSGSFINKTNKDFNIITGNKEFLYKDNIILSYTNCDKEYSVFCFTKKDIDDLYKKDRKASQINKYYEMYQRLSGIVLVKRDDSILSFFNEMQLLRSVLIQKSFEEMLGFTSPVKDDEEDNSNEKDNNEEIKTTSFLFPFGMPMVLEYSDESAMRSKNEDDLELVDISRKNKKEKNFELDKININDIISDINSKIVGQEKAVKTLVTNIYYNQVLIENLSKNDDIDSSELDSRKISILLDGSTGTGKTAILKEIAAKLDLPIDIVNANSFSETGYVGPTITDILSRLLKKANGNLELAERGIIVLDEIDKIATPDTYDTRDMKKGVQEELLSFIGGGKYDIAISSGFMKNSVSFDTSKITFILSGAFTKLREDKIQEQEKKINGMGFNSGNNDLKNEYEITSQDYIDYGLMREFFGRIKVLTSTKSYSIDDLKTILLNSKISPLKNFEKTIQMFGYNNLKYNDEVLDKICEEAYKLDTGARGLQSIMANIQNKILIDLINQTYNLNEPIEINDNLLDEYKKDNIRTYTRKK